MYYELLKETFKYASSLVEFHKVMDWVSSHSFLKHVANCDDFMLPLGNS